jgi:two-component system, cell cycle sensor histidine kinase and response regulator CckA
LVDDEKPIRDLGQRILSRFGYEVLFATNGKEALEIYRRKARSISLVIMDLIMPEVGGKQCMAELLKLDPKVKVLVASGYASDESDATEMGACGFIRKPFDRRALLRSVRDILDSD